MDRRQAPRVEVQLPVQVWGVDAHGQAFTDPAIVTNMSSSGLVLQGLRRKLRTGELLDVRLDGQVAQYRVVWVGGPATRHAGEFGMERATAEAFMLEAVLSCSSQLAGTC